MSSSDLVRTIPELTDTNYGVWAPITEAVLRTKGVHGIVTGKEASPPSLGSGSTSVAERAERRDYDNRNGIAAGLIYLAVGPAQRVHLNDIRDDPQKMWQTLLNTHRQKQAGSRFNAYDNLFLLEKTEDESLMTLASRVNRAMSDIKALRPDKYTLETQDQELESMALIRALGPEYDNFVSSILIMKGELKLSELLTAFQTEETQCRSREEKAARAAAANPVFSPSPSRTPSTSSTTKVCAWCGITGHLEEDCFKKRKSRERDGQRALEKRGGNRANLAEEMATQASVNPSDPITHSWNTDTGASSHMTPHREWFTSYTPRRTPVRLADNSLIYAVGIGSVGFMPEDGNEVVTFENVLHVPALRNNLLSVYTLSVRHGYRITIKDRCVMFSKDQSPAFSATVNPRMVGYLNGTSSQHANLFTATANAVSTRPLDLELWHRRLAHVNYDTIGTMVKNNLVNGLVLKLNSKPDPICEPCIHGKQHRHSVPRHAPTVYTRPLELIVSDVKGPMPTTSRQGNRYWVTWICAAMQMQDIDFLRQKSGTLASFERFKAYAENFHGMKIKVLREDKGGEYMSKALAKICEREGIGRQHTEPDEPHQNGIAERANRTISDGVDTLLAQANLPPSFWQDAARVVVAVRMCCPTASHPDTTPFTNWNKKRPDISKFRIFGCLSYVLVKKKKRGRSRSHTCKCIFIGYAKDTAAYLFWDPVGRREIISTHVIFDERYFPGNSKDILKFPSMAAADIPDTTPIGAPPAGSDEALPFLDDLDPSPSPHHGGDDEPDAAPVPQDPVHDIQPRSPVLNSPAMSLPSLPSLTPSPKQSPQQDMAELPPEIPRAPQEPRIIPGSGGLIEAPTGYGRGHRRVPQLNGEWRYEDAAQAAYHEEEDEDALNWSPDDNSILEGMVFTAESTESHTFDEALHFAYEIHVERAAVANSAAPYMTEPKSYREAMRRPPEEAAQWQKAAADELESLIEHGVYELVPRPEGRTPIGNRWVFRIKKNADGTVERLKARLVAKGYSQRPGFDYNETFSPTPKWASIRAILALGALEDLCLTGVDISSAFLNGDLKHEVYMEQAEGCEEKGPGWVWRLLKSLYGLKQAGRQWHEKLNEILTKKMGFKQVCCDNSIWVFKRGSCRIIIPVFVDDMTLATKTNAEAQDVIAQLRQHFKLRDLGPTTWLLGVEIKCDRVRCSLTLSQKQYATDILAVVSKILLAKFSKPFKTLRVLYHQIAMIKGFLMVQLSWSFELF